MINFLFKVIKRSIKSNKKTYCKKLIKNKEKLRRKILEESYELISESQKKQISKKNIGNEFCDLIFHATVYIYKYKISKKNIYKILLKRNKSK